MSRLFFASRDVAAEARPKPGCRVELVGRRGIRSAGTLSRRAERRRDAAASPSLSRLDVRGERCFTRSVSRTSPSQPCFANVRGVDAHIFSTPTFRRHYAPANARRLEYQSHSQRSGSQKGVARSGASAEHNRQAGTPWSERPGILTRGKFARPVLVDASVSALPATDVRLESAG